MSFEGGVGFVLKAQCHKSWWRKYGDSILFNVGGYGLNLNETKM